MSAGPTKAVTGGLSRVIVMTPCFCNDVFSRRLEAQIVAFLPTGMGTGFLWSLALGLNRCPRIDTRCNT